MIKTPNLDLPIYDKPDTDTFKVADWNKANENIDYVFGELKKNPSVNAIDITARQDIINNHRKVTEQLESIEQKKADKTELNRLDVELGNKVNKNIALYVTRDTILICKKHNAVTDIRYSITNKNVNGTWQFERFYLFSNPLPYPSTDFTSYGVSKLNGGTDFCSPYKVKPVNNCDGDYAGGTPRFTGGFHEINGNIGTLQRDNLKATAKNYKCVIRTNEANIDVTKVTTPVILRTNNCEIDVINKVQSWATMKNNGEGREVLRENVLYTIDTNKIDMLFEIEASEDIDVTVWYGFILALQGAGGNIASVMFSGNKGNVITRTVNSLEIYIGRDTNRVEFWSQDRSFKLIQDIKPIGLGGWYAKKEGNNYYIATTNDKVYPCIINKDDSAPHRISWGEKALFNCTIKTLSF